MGVFKRGAGGRRADVEPVATCCNSVLIKAYSSKELLREIIRTLKIFLPRLSIYHVSYKSLWEGEIGKGLQDDTHQTTFETMN